MVLRDVHYDKHRTLAELDGRFGHTDTEDRWDDLERDVAAASSGRITLRLGWRQVLEPCRSAGAIGAVLRANGWPGEPVPCGPTCLVNTGGSGSPGDPDPPRTPLSA